MIRCNDVTIFFPCIKYQKFNGVNIPFENNFFDRIVISHCLEHILNPEKFLFEMLRVCKPEGIISIALPTDPGFFWRLGRFFIKKFIQKKTHKLTDLDYDYVNAIEHVNSIFNLRIIIKKKFNINCLRFLDFFKPSFYLIDRDNKKIIDLVKIDTEGSELDILKGMGPTIKNIKIIQFEFGSSNIDSKNFFIEFYIFFTKNNFDIYRITPGIPRKVTYSYFDEVFSTNNYIAVNKSLFKN